MIIELMMVPRQNQEHSTNQIDFWTSDIPKFDHKLEINFTILVLYMCYQDVCYK